MKRPTQILTSDLVGQIEPVDSLTNRDVEQLIRLMHAYYEGVRADDFQRDLGEKQWVITLRLVDGTICGFSTQVMLPIPGQVDALALFSGDTVVAKAYGNNHTLAGLWGKLALEQIDAHRDKRLYWFLISKGYKTYRYLPLFFKEYYPHRARPTPTEVKEWIDRLARHKFGERYDAMGQVVRANSAAVRLRPSVAPVDDGRQRNPDVHYFVRLNPGHGRGDELCCLAPLRRDNFTAAAYRVIQAARCSVVP